MVVNSSVGTSETPAINSVKIQSRTPKTKMNPKAPKIWRMSKDAWLGIRKQPLN